MRWMVVCAGLVLSTLSSSSPADAAKRDGPGDSEFLDLAATLAADGNYDRAAVLIDQVDTSAKDVDLARFHLIRGIIRLNRSLYAQAADDFESSIAEERKKEDEDGNPKEPRPVLYVYLGQSYFYAKKYEESLDALAKAGEKTNEIRSTFALRAEAAWNLKRYDEAWSYLNLGQERFPEYHELLRRKVFYAIKLKLYQTATELGQAYLARTEADFSDYNAIGSAMYESGATQDALKFLELARLRNPGEPRASIQLARVYGSNDQPRTAATLMERVAFAGTQEAFIDAVEYYREAKELYRALSLNRYIANSETRLKQRLALRLDLGDYEAVAAMERDLRLAGLMSDENIRYAVAYCHFKTGNFSRTEELLSGLSDPGLFRKAAELRRAMERCNEERWKC
ncbi:MAG: hypothetical protein ACFB9M_02160 [Myxococcota bacterium]